MMAFKVASLNLCLGLQNKKPIVKQLTIDKNINILCKQETKAEINLDKELLSFLGYKYENELSTVKARVGAYVSSKLIYVRHCSKNHYSL
jgi:exonuclease III